MVGGWFGVANYTTSSTQGFKYSSVTDINADYPDHPPFTQTHPPFNPNNRLSPQKSSSTNVYEKENCLGERKPIGVFVKL